MENVKSGDLLPHWAKSTSDGNYMQMGAVLPTRDGRRTGNATVVGIAAAPRTRLNLVGVENRGDGRVATVVTDAGNRIRLTEPEMRELFWPPEWVKSDGQLPLCSHGESWDDCPVCCH